MDSRPLTRASMIDSRPLTRASMIDNRQLTTRGSSRQKAYSAPVPLDLGGDSGGVEPEVEGGATAQGLDLNQATAGERIIATPADTRVGNSGQRGLGEGLRE